MNYKFKTKPYEHQLKALERSWDKEYFAYFMEMGTGKSKVLIDNASMLYDKGEINGLLLVAPKGVYKNWYDGEIPTHMVNHIEKKVVLWETSNSSMEKIKELNTLFATGTDFHILVMNVEAFSYPKATEFARSFLYCQKAMMEIDDDQKEPGTIIQEIQKGFTIKDRLLRPSLVGVSKKTEKKDPNTKEKKENFERK